MITGWRRFWRQFPRHMNGFRWLVVIVALLTILISVPTSWALTTGGYCADELIPGGSSFEVAPYVQQVTETSADVRWHTNGDTSGLLAYGDSRSLGSSVDGGAGQWHLARLTGLQPNTIYYYRVAPSAPVQLATAPPNTLPQTVLQAFRTSPGTDGTITFGVIGDSGTGGQMQTTMATVLADQHPNLVLHLGDVVSPRGADCFYPSRYYLPYRNLTGAVPFYPTLGDHDLKSERGKAYFTTFVLPANNPEHSERFYSFNAGPVHFVALDSELYHGDGDVTAAQQKAWLEQDLATNTRPWKVVYLHRPLYSDGEQGGDPAIRADLEPVFAKYKVNVVLSGHDHDYERFKPINGVTYIVSGGGGAGLTNVGRSAHTADAASVNNILKVTATPESLLIQAVNNNGQVFDHVELTQ